MIKFKRSWILPAILSAAFFFLLIQYLVFNTLTTTADSANKFQPAQARKSNEDIIINNEQFNIRGRTIIVSPPIASRLITSSVISTKRTSHQIKQIQVPLDEDNKPDLKVQLPFYNVLNLKFMSILIDEPEHDSSKSADSSIRGVDRNKRLLYRPSDTDGLFKCIDSNQRIPYANLNDDYCDCVDGSDEPGTSACQYSKFYCTAQSEFLKNNFIASSRVDDGICDCCDGSDELKKRCRNLCNHQIAAAQGKANKAQQGLARKKNYLDNGVSKDEIRYGPSGVFFLLSKSCFKIKWSEYTFEVCPFNKVTQYKGHAGNSLMNLGHVSSLELVKNEWRLKFSRGDPSNCGHPRSSEVFFTCGLRDELLSVQENEKCLYVFKLSTPAAC